MATNENIDFRKRSMDELLDQLDTDTQYNARNYQNIEMPREYATDPSYMPQRGNMYFPEQFPTTEPRNTLPFMFNTREDVMPTMVGMGGGNFMVYGTPNVERSVNVSNNLNFVNKTNGNLSGLNNYPSDYALDYNLFSSGVNSVGPTYTTPAEAASTGRPHLIENLVGHWGYDQSGTYTPFGPCTRNVPGQNLGDIGNERTGKKTRMVAEVRPMRPSYSDVLAKSVPNQKPGKPVDGKARPSEVKNGKGNKSSVGRSLSGNAHFNNRQNLSGGDEQLYTGSNSSLKASEVKKLMDVETDEPLPKKWVSLDDLTGGLSDKDLRSDAQIKKNSTLFNKIELEADALKQKDGWEKIQLNTGKNTPGKPSSGKKNSGNVGPKIQIVNRERDSSSGLKFEATRGKTSPEDRKGAPVGQGKPLDSNKSSRRNSRGVQAEKGKKGARRGRRDVGVGWVSLLANRVDLIAALALRAAHWLVSLVLDVFALSTNLALYMCTVFWCSSVSSMAEHYGRVSDWLRGLSIVKRIASSRFWPFGHSDRLPPPSDDDDDTDSEDSDGKKKKRLPGGLKHNLPLPSTGEEAMKRLLACKGKDPYSILGVSQDCTDDDIKKYYKRQAFLVHPDKNNQPGAEEAFKILVHAFDIIGEPEHRKSYDRTAEKTAQAEQAWSELSDLLAQLHKKMEYVANTLRCTNCGKRHKRSVVNRPIYAARMCAQCKIHHSVREGDIWAETTLFGLTWRYFACMDGAVYDISEWAACQGSNLKNLKANTHQVQYRIVLGKQAQKNRSQQSTNANGEPDLEEFINNLYSKPESGSGGDGGGDIGGRNRKHKRKK